MPVPTLDDVKIALNVTTSANDAELYDLLAQALAEYAEHVRPLPGPRTERLSGGGSALLLDGPAVGSTLTSAAYTSGTVIPLTGLDLDAATGILHVTGSSLAHGSRNVSVTYTVGDIPANHAGAIIDDVAGLWSATQRASGPPRGPFEADEPTVRPITRFPRIAALSPPRIA